VIKAVAVGVLCLSVLSGCASFMSGATGASPVGTESGVRSLGQVFIDSSIVRTAKINLYKLDERFDKSRVNIESFHGHVLLTGQVPDQHLKQLAEENVRAMSDVKAVHNYITVGQQIGYGTIMQDTTTTANARALIMKATLVSDAKVHVHTENSVLYVMGKLNSAEISDLNEVLQKIGNVSRIVALIDNTEQQAVAPNAAYSQVSDTSVQATPIAIDLDN
jgi:osmotically-inducible protein OsmY